MKVFVCLFAVIAYASASVISSCWNDWPSRYRSGWSHAVAPVKIVKVVAPSHGWSSGWKPSYSSGWWPSSGWSSGWPSSSGWNAWPSKVSYGWPSKAAVVGLADGQVAAHGQAAVAGQVDGQASDGAAMHGQAAQLDGGKSKY